MDYLYDLMRINQHIIPTLCSTAAYLKDNPNKYKLMVILNALGPIVVELRPIVEDEWPEYSEILNWIEQEYDAWTARETWE